MAEYLLKKSMIADYEFLRNVHHVTLKEHIEKIWGWNEPLQDDFFKQEFDSNLIQIIQVSQNNVGYLILHENKESVYVVELLILPEFQNRGLGTQILKDIIAQTEQLNLNLKIGVFKVNTRAKDLYLDLGFVLRDQTDTHYLMEYEKP